MDRVAAFVDAGYLFAAGAVLISGQNRPRGELELDFDGILDAIEQLATRVSGLPLLRIYWYDGTATGPTPQHLALAFKPRLKLRLGFVNAVGEQKGVDSLLVTDMIMLARNRAMTDAVLMTGDEDIRVGVQQAQEFGVRVHLLGIKPSRGNQSQFLLQEADSVHEWAEDVVAAFLHHRPRMVTPAGVTNLQDGASALRPDASVSLGTPSIDTVAAKYAEEVPESAMDAILRFYESSRQLPADIDRPLLGRAKNQLGMLKSEEKRLLRDSFALALRRRQGQ
ncbi:MAG: NYN domain-containing protein [Verrucomicrobia bacterium]|nr:NYN domain-containing protein [Verrucomicrobiota bacterium]